MAEIIFNHVGVTYSGVQQEQDALDDLCFEVADGESVAIIGPSGCGKSTTLQLAAGLLQPTKGEVRVAGEVPNGPRRSTALILQDFGLLPWKTVQQNVELGLKIRKMPRAERAKRATEMLQLVGLGHMASAYPRELSGGMQQRLAIARALALDVDLLLMDEPLSALDALLREQLQETLLELWQSHGYSQVLVTHSIEEAVYLGQRIFVMKLGPGRMVACVENPLVGTSGWRENPDFFERCTQLRTLLREVAGEPGDESQDAKAGESHAS